MDLEKLIFELCSAFGVSGGEQSAAEVVKKYLPPQTKAYSDSNGNLFAVLGNENADKTLLLDAHIDRIGLLITDISDEGFVKVDKLGGIDQLEADAQLLNYSSEGLVETSAACLTLIPYYAWANRDKSKMAVWLPQSVSRVIPIQE